MAGEHRGHDGLTRAELRRSRAQWWDEPFTRLLTDAIPADARLVADFGCGLGMAATALLPVRTSMTYVGIDLDAERLREARSDAPERSRFLRADVERVPLADARFDCVLTTMTLQHVRDVPAALSEARRILRDGGRIVTVEPENGNQFAYFDGPRPAICAGIAALHAIAREVRPGDISIGPRMPALLERAGFRDVTLCPHLVHVTERQTAERFAERAREVVGFVATMAEVAEDAPERRAALDAIDRFLADRDPHEQGSGSFGTPVFRAVGVR